MHRAALVFVLISLLSSAAYARSAQTGVGAILLIAVVLGAAFVMIFVLFGTPIKLINMAFGKTPDDDFGGKTFAISCVVSPFFCLSGAYLGGAPLAIIGWLVGIYVTGKFVVKS